MQERVSSAEVAKAFDRFLKRSSLMTPNRLHRVVAMYTGLHPTTVLRYHRQELESADAKVLHCLRALEERFERGELLFDGDGALTADGEVSYRVSVHEVQRWFNRVFDLIGDQGRYVVYRYVAEKLDVHPTTAMRYHTGELDGAPSKIIPVLRDLAGKLGAGERVVFRHGPGDGDEVVPLCCVLPLLDEIESLGIVTSDLDSSLERMTRIRRGTLHRIRQPGGWPFVKLKIFDKLTGVRDGAIYDPCRHYEIGDRLHHHDLGAGTVVGKHHKSRILVEFADGKRRFLREDVRLDPRWPHPQT